MSKQSTSSTKVVIDKGLVAAVVMTVLSEGAFGGVSTMIFAGITTLVKQTFGEDVAKELKEELSYTSANAVNKTFVREEGIQAFFGRISGFAMQAREDKPENLAALEQELEAVSPYGVLSVDKDGEVVYHTRFQLERPTGKITSVG